MWKGEDDIRWTDSSLHYGYVCSPFLSDYDKGSSMPCALMTENECWISFNVVDSETGTTAYNLQMYGKPETTTTSTTQKKTPDKIIGSRGRICHLLRCPVPRLPRASEHPHDYPGGLPFRCVHRPDPAGRVEGAGVGPRP